MSFDKIYWCSIGFTPEEVAFGKCDKYSKLEYGCYSCSDWKMMSMSEIQSLPRQTSLPKTKGIGLIGYPKEEEAHYGPPIDPCLLRNCAVCFSYAGETETHIYCNYPIIKILKKRYEPILYGAPEEEVARARARLASILTETSNLTTS